MPLNLIAYSSMRLLPEMKLPHIVNEKCGVEDRALKKHVNDLVVYIRHYETNIFSQNIYELIKYVQRIKYFISVTIAESDLPLFMTWALDANAILMWPDNTLRDASSLKFFDLKDSNVCTAAKTPYPLDAVVRKNTVNTLLEGKGILTLPSLPPVLSEGEVVTRSPKEIACRSLALFLVSLQAEALSGNDKIRINELKNVSAIGYKALSRNELEFICADHPSAQTVINYLWRYESLNILLWALKCIDYLPYPSVVSNASSIADIILDLDQKYFVADAELRPVTELLDALDLHYRLHWAVRQAHLSKKIIDGLERGVVQERHYALNWVLQFENENIEWDNVQTST